MVKDILAERGRELEAQERELVALEKAIVRAEHQRAEAHWALQKVVDQLSLSRRKTPNQELVAQKKRLTDKFAEKQAACKRLYPGRTALARRLSKLYRKAHQRRLAEGPMIITPLVPRFGPQGKKREHGSGSMSFILRDTQEYHALLEGLAVKLAARWADVVR